MCYKNRIDMLKIIVFILLLGSLPVYAQSDLEISGKLRTLEALELFMLMPVFSLVTHAQMLWLEPRARSMTKQWS